MSLTHAADRIGIGFPAKWKDPELEGIFNF